MLGRREVIGLFTVAMIMASPWTRLGAATDPQELQPFVRQDAGPMHIGWLPQVGYEDVVLTVSGPEGLILRREFAAGAMVVFEAVGDDGKLLPDGAYSYELVAAPMLDRATRQALAAARQNGDDSVIAKLQAAGKLPRTPMIQSGSFKIAGGILVQDDVKEPQPNGTAQSKARPPATVAEQVILEDLIVQGSECVGLDCVDNESFGFDTIRLKENNTRIKFDDTSTTGFPANDWQLTANDSASSGSNKFSIEDITGAKVPFTITAGASNNSIFVDSASRVGFRTSTPVLDLHVATSNTPALRLEQNNSGGFTAQTWDIGANETNFFVRDVTGGQSLPFRIRPGAPTSSIDISANGNVGIGTASPEAKLHVFSSNTTDAIIGMGPDPDGSPGTESAFTIFYGGSTGGPGSGIINVRPSSSAVAPNPSLRFQTGNVERMIITNTGNVGIGASNPEAKLHVFGSNTADAIIGLGPNPDGSPGTESAFNIFYSGATSGRGSGGINVRPDSGAVAPNPSLRFWVANVERVIIDNEGFIGLGVANPSSPIHHSSGAILTAGGTWQNGSSRDIKQDIIELAAEEAMATLQGLDPVKYAYRIDPRERHVGFIAEDVPDLVAAPDRKSLSPMDIVAVLTKVVQEQQKTIDELTAKMAKLEKKAP
jgi:endosialidase-like protein